MFNCLGKISGKTNLIFFFLILMFPRKYCIAPDTFLIMFFGFCFVLLFYKFLASPQKHIPLSSHNTKMFL